MNDVPIQIIVDMLRNDADSLARYLLPGGSYQIGSNEWKCRGTNSPTGEAISVHVGQGDKRGVVGFWNNTPPGGDLLDLIQLVQGTTKGMAVLWAKEWLGINDEHATRLNLKQRKQEQKAWNRQNDERKIADRERRLQNASTIWKDSKPLHGVACTYLSSRGIDPSVADGEIRSHAGLPHPEGGTFPALVARVKNLAGRGVGVWRVFVKPDGSGKAPVETPRLGLGSTKGGAVQIGGVWSEIGVAEGIETALACRQIIAEMLNRTVPVWAALSTSGMRAIELPPGAMFVRIFADADPIKFRNGQITPSPGIEAAEELMERLRNEGRTVTIESPPSGMDWLDVLKSQQVRKAA